ncbi:hypothetical protein M8818_005058 [Zalaria obscura]|uniref:Uncharacterized protein n=1 Tax=Zalaria obscura TaxID=2024903 RepID=A0ACC3S9Y4_9PEZI
MSCPEYATGWYNDGFWTSGFDALSGELYGPYAPSQPLPPLLNPATRQYVVDVLYASDEALPIRPHRMEMPLQPLSPTNAQMNRSTGLLRSVVITDDSSDERNAKRRKIEKPKRKTVAEMRMEQAEKERASDAAAARAKTELLAPRRNKTRDAEIIVIEDEPTTSENKPADLPEVGQAQVPTYSPESPRVRIDSEKWYREYLMQQNERKRKAMLTANLSTLGHASPGTQLDPFAGSQYPQQGNQFIPSVAQAPLPGTYPSPIGLPQPGDPFYSSTLPPTPPLSSPAYNFAPPQQVQQWTADTMPPPTPVKKPQASQPRTEPVLCKEQADLVDLITSGKNVFYTGSAGCGKSTVLKAFTSKLKEAGKTVKIIAPTGRAALDINGSTFWTYAGWNPNNMKKPIEELEKGAMYHSHRRDQVNELGDEQPYSLLSRTQIPLSAAWAMTVHKSQGVGYYCAGHYDLGYYDLGIYYVGIQDPGSIFVA